MADDYFRLESPRATEGQLVILQTHCFLKIQDSTSHTPSTFRHSSSLSFIISNILLYYLVTHVLWRHWNATLLHYMRNDGRERIVSERVGSIRTLIIIYHLP